MHSLSDDAFDMVTLVLVLFIATLVLSYCTQELYPLVVENTNAEKVEVSYESTENPYELTAYQAYMLGYVMDNYAPENKNTLFYDNATYAVLSPKAFGYNYTVRNQLIREKVKASLLTGITADTQTKHYRGLDGKRYNLEFRQNTNSVAPTVNNSVYKGYLWAITRT